jgi:chromate reductase
MEINRMKPYQITALVGSLRQASYNLRLAKAISQLSENKLQIHIANIADLPLYNQDNENPLPEAVARLKSDIEKADAILFVSPEYNRSFPGVLKNAIDWASRPYGKNSFSKKRAALCGASVGAIGAACAQNALKPVLSYLEVNLMGQPEVYLHLKENSIDHDGHVLDESMKTFLKSFVDKFILWIEGV